MREFSAKIFKVGINPCVDAPEEISRAFGKRGYIPVRGTLNGHPVRANLIPIGGGRHRLFLNAEMRKGAKADTGDTVRVALEIDTESRELAMPDDLAEALQAAKGAAEAFEATTPSRRKELLTMLLHTKLPETRRRRIERIVDQLAGAGTHKLKTQKPLWTCPKCKRQFANTNQSHSCAAYFVEDFLRGKDAKAVELYEKFAALVRECGAVKLAPAKTRIGFQVRMIFAAVNKLSRQGLDAHVILTRRFDHPRFTRIEEISPRCFVHHFRIKGQSELDGEVIAWLKEAYRVGQQSHLKR
jgi:hypothetical protein